MPCFQFAARPFLPAPRISVRVRKDSVMVSTGSTAPSFSRKISFGGEADGDGGWRLFSGFESGLNSLLEVMG